MKDLIIVLIIAGVGYYLYKKYKNLDVKPLGGNNGQKGVESPNIEQEEKELSPYELEEILEQSLSKLGVDVANGNLENIYYLGQKDLAKALLEIILDETLTPLEKKKKILKTIDKFKGNKEILNFRIDLDIPVRRLSMRLDALRREYGIYGIDDPIEIINKLIPTMYKKGIEEAKEYLAVSIQSLKEANTEEEISKILENLKIRLENLLNQD